MRSLLEGKKNEQTKKRTEKNEEKKIITELTKSFFLPFSLSLLFFFFLFHLLASPR